MFYELNAYSMGMENCSAYSVGRRIRSCMILRGYTQNDLANLLGITQATASRKLRNISTLSTDEVISVANWLGVSVSDLFEPLPDQPELVEAVA